MTDTVEEHSIRVEPLGIVLHCNEGETLIQCAWRSGFYWPTVCGGIGECGACRCEVAEGHQFAESMARAEKLFFETRPQTSSSSRTVRLACCMKVRGPMTVFKSGVSEK